MRVRRGTLRLSDSRSTPKPFTGPRYVLCLSPTPTQIRLWTWRSPHSWRRLGELLRDMDDRDERPRERKKESHAVTLSDLGISKPQSSRWQQISLAVEGGVGESPQSQFLARTTLPRSLKHPSSTNLGALWERDRSTHRQYNALALVSPGTPSRVHQEEDRPLFDREKYVAKVSVSLIARDAAFRSRRLCTFRLVPEGCYGGLICRHIKLLQ